MDSRRPFLDRRPRLSLNDMTEGGKAMTTKPYEAIEGSPPINPVERLAALVGERPCTPWTRSSIAG